MVERKKSAFENPHRLIRNLPRRSLESYVDILETVENAMKESVLNCSEDFIAIKHEHESVEYFDDEMAYFESFL